jgi:hypothetical protein
MARRKAQNIEVFCPPAESLPISAEHRRSNRHSGFESSLNRFRFMSVLLERTQPYNERVSGEHVTMSSQYDRHCRAKCAMGDRCVALLSDVNRREGKSLFARAGDCGAQKDAT